MRGGGLSHQGGIAAASEPQTGEETGVLWEQQRRLGTTHRETLLKGCAGRPRTLGFCGQKMSQNGAQNGAQPNQCDTPGPCVNVSAGEELYSDSRFLCKIYIMYIFINYIFLSYI